MQMVHSRLFALLAITLCLVFCICANAWVNEKEAMQAVKKTQTFTKSVLDYVKKAYTFVDSHLSKMNKFKSRAKDAASKSEQTANMHPKAQPIAAEIKKGLGECLKLYNELERKATDVLKYIKSCMPEIEDMHERALNDYFVPKDPKTGFAPMKERAKTLKRKANKVSDQRRRDMPKVDSSVIIAYGVLERATDKIVMKNYHCDSIGAVSKIEHKLKESVTNIAIMEKDQNEIEVISKELNNIHAKAPDNLKAYIHTLYSATEGDLKSATTAVEEAYEAHQEMIKRKKEATDALEKVKAATKVKDAKKDAGTPATAATEVEKKAEEVNKKAEAVKAYSANARARKEAAEKSIEKGEEVAVTKEDATPDPSAEGSPDGSTDKEGGLTWMYPWRDSATGAMNKGTISIMGASSISAMAVVVTLLLALITCATLH